MCKQTHGWAQRESCSCGNLNHTWGIYSGFPLASHLALPGSEFIFGFSPDPPVCVCASLSQDEPSEEACG